MAERHRRLPWLALFAVSMAYLEAAVVVYLRRIYYPDDLLNLFPLSVWDPAHLFTELGREVSTVVMILAVAIVAERGKMRVFAAFSFLFGVWDVFYYLWLKVLIGWPVSWQDWDILFLIPWPWLAPWGAPVLIAVVLASWGWRVLSTDRPCRFTALSAGLFAAGVLVVLACFLAPAYPLLGGGPGAVAGFSPGGFLAAPYFAGALMTAVGLGMTFSRRGGGGEDGS